MTYTNKRTKKLSTPVEALLVILAAALVAALFIGSLAYALQPTDFSEYEVETYIVEKGDTLWTIGERATGGHCDIREWIYEVNKINNLGTYIYPGQHIDVYVYPGCSPYGD